MNFLESEDPDIYRAVQAEYDRQRSTINLIASENYCSAAILEAQGSPLTNKYAEGYPGKRYYGGCENVDTIETIAIDRAKELFKAEYANVQPHSGAQANMAAYFTLLKYGDRVLGMDLAHGGHLTHGASFNFSGKFYNFIAYGLNRETERIDYAEIERLAKEQQPALIVTGSSAYPRFIDFERFRHIADSVGARLMVDMAHIAGLVAAGVHPSPVPYADIVTSTTHKTLRGPRGGFILCRKELGRKIDSAVFPMMQGGPLVHVITAKAVCFKEALKPEFVRYQEMVVANAALLAKELQNYGLRIISGGTDNHLILVDLNSNGVTGKQVEEALGSVGIVINRNAVPFDQTHPPAIAGGMRLGTPSVTSRGFGPDEIKEIARIIASITLDIENADLKAAARESVKNICSRFPVPGIDA
ncbi:MAG: serine hydroxymethyltransferase [Dehalococcoidales bacterium]|jgi:glycine hydroxymethyltransferase|nr:serine hydroxymethyltransferase [Dehalococcoidales bacterium]MDD4229855.1 serine hydroxymethyltransferase [Dehalococcoidales bacterium]MDD4465178.1 serine hydroxymethyltransferase [Dehalococcoidales bacterium]MDD5402303.1 serine hydroxymethyltransferase [Dehalococcoidales bacterium]